MWQTQATQYAAIRFRQGEISLVVAAMNKGNKTRHTWYPVVARGYSLALNTSSPSLVHDGLTMSDAYYRYHVFFCVNQRTGGQECCADKGAVAMRDYAKARIKKLGLDGKGQVRINQAGCLDRCAQGPAMVVYPEGVWYSYSGTTDIDAIIDEHLVQGRPVERLKI